MTFDDFWAVYPRRVAKLAASKAWAKLTSADQIAACQALPVHRALWSERSLEHVPHAATWLNGRRWEDELTPQANQKPMSDHEFFRIHGYSRQSREEAS